MKDKSAAECFSVTLVPLFVMLFYNKDTGKRLCLFASVSLFIWIF